MNEWRGVTILLRKGGQGFTTPIHTLAHPTHTHTDNHKRSMKIARFRTFQLDHHVWTDRRMNGPMYRRTDKASYIFACPQLKKVSFKNWHFTNRRPFFPHDRAWIFDEELGKNHGSRTGEKIVEIRQHQEKDPEKEAKTDPWSIDDDDEAKCRRWRWRPSSKLSANSASMSLSL